MRFRDTGSVSSGRQRAAQRLAEIEREISEIRRLFPDLTNAPSRSRSRRFEQRHRDRQADGDGRSGRYLIH